MVAKSEQVAAAAAGKYTSDPHHNMISKDMSDVLLAFTEAMGLAEEGKQRLASLQQLQHEVAERAAHTRRALYMLS